MGSASGLVTGSSWTAVGENSGDDFASCVATAGDVNGDGYSDVIIGAPAFDNGGPGKVYVYLGSAGGPPASPSWTFTGEAGGDRFGYSVSTAGDINGDGYSDIIIGAYGNNGGTGKVYVFEGSASGLAATSAWTMTGEAGSDNFGYTVATAGDVNGDGYSDVIIGAPAFDNGGPGKVYVYLSSISGLATTADWTAVGAIAGDHFGYCVATAGDVNGDGYSDVIVGEPYKADQTAEVFLYSGSASGLSASPLWTNSGGINSFFGHSVATAGDVNGDGYSDIIIGMPVAYGYSKGYAGVYLGSPSGPSASYSLGGQQQDDKFGCSVATAGDVNGDGLSDVIVGAYRDTNFTGKAYVYLGGASGLSTSSSWTALGENTNNNFGISIASAGDVNGDGYSDVVVGAESYSGYIGKAYLYLGGPSGLSSTASWTKTGEATYNYFGHSVASAGDVNGDGYSDVVVGAYGYGSYAGKTYVYTGGPSGLSETASWTTTGEATYNYFGYSVATAGDVNGDGYGDLLVGAWGYNNVGKAYLYLGGTSGLPGTAAWTAAGEGGVTYYGITVATAGDVNRDGYSDIVVGAPNYNSSTGKVYLYMGGASGLTATASWTATGEASGSDFGASVSTAGDVNGDGYADLIVGAYKFYDNNDVGKAYLYLGGPSGLASNAAWTAQGYAFYYDFGYSVGTAGDVNGDGYSDVVVGSRYDLSNLG